jgi:nitrate/nitrite transporter NarK
MTQSVKPAFFYGWLVVGVGFYSNLINTGTGFYMWNVFQEPILAELGWSRTQYSTGLGLNMFTNSFVGLLAGYLVSRLGPRPLMVFGAVLNGLAFIFLSRMQTVWEFYLGLGLGISLAGSFLSGVVVNSAVANWFVLERGRALGITTMGISVSGVVLPLLARSLLRVYGDWRMVFFTLALAVWATLIPLVLVLVKGRPEELGLLPDNADPRRPAPAALAEDQQRWSGKAVLRTPAFWKIVLPYAAAITALSAILSQLVPRFTDAGFSPDQATLILVGSSVMGAAGKYYWGLLCDRHPVERIGAILFLLQAGSILVLLLWNSLAGVLIFTAVYGFSMGGVLSTFPIVTAATFGRRSFAIVSGLMSPLLALRLAGTYLLGQCYDRYGSYDRAYLFFMIAYFLAAGVIISLRKPPAPAAGSGLLSSPFLSTI